MKKFLEGIIVGIAGLVLLLTVGATALASGLPSKGEKPNWDKSSLSFTNTCDESCDGSTVKVCNTGDGDMASSSTYMTYYIESGNPKGGSVVAQGSIPALKSGGCFDIAIDTSETGNYMVRAFQIEGHPGTGELWSEACSLMCEGTDNPEDPDDDPEEPEQCPETMVFDGCEYTLTQSCLTK